MNLPIRPVRQVALVCIHRLEEFPPSYDGLLPGTYRLMVSTASHYNQPIYVDLRLPSRDWGFCHLFPIEIAPPKDALHLEIFRETPESAVGPSSGMRLIGGGRVEMREDGGFLKGVVELKKAHGAELVRTGRAAVTIEVGEKRAMEAKYVGFFIRGSSGF